MQNGCGETDAIAGDELQDIEGEHQDHLEGGEHFRQAQGIGNKS